MNSFRRCVPLVVAGFLAVTATVISSPAQNGRDLFGVRVPGIPTEILTAGQAAGLSEEKITSGLKEALGNGVQKAVASLGKTNGFLGDPAVRIPMPASLQKVDKSLRALGQQQLADEFVATMNHAAELAVPEAAAVLRDSVKQMTIADARAILTGTNNAATRYFRRTSETNLHAKFLPIVRTATAKAGVTAAYKQMTEQAAASLGGLGGLGNLGGLSAGLLGKEMPDLDQYVTRKALDGLFAKIAAQEALIRANPTARTSELLKQVFGAVAR